MSPSQVEQRESEQVLSCIPHFSDANGFLRETTTMVLKLCRQESPKGHLWLVNSAEVLLFPLIS